MELKNRILIHSVLKRLEWRWREGHQECPICREAYKYGHAPDCELNKSIEILLTAEDDSKFC